MVKTKESQEKQFIHLTGVKTNNLKNIEAQFPLNQLSVVTGVSGSGKSSLVFDTLFAESYRRYIESLSSFARQYIKSLPKPMFKSMLNLPAAIAVRQSKGAANSRSTVGSLTEVHDLLQNLFCYLSSVVCPTCGAVIKAYNSQSLLEQLLAEHKQSVLFRITAPLIGWKMLTSEQLKSELLHQGFVRLVDPSLGVVELQSYQKQSLHECAVLIDELIIHKDNTQRVLESLQLGFQIGRGQLALIDEQKKKKVYSTRYSCQTCSKEFLAPTISMFSFNHPMGACSSCQGYGKEALIDWEKVFPDKEQSIQSKGILPLAFGDHSHYYQTIEKNASKQKINLKKKFKDYNLNEMKWLKSGDGNTFGGMEGYFKWLDSKRYKPHYRMHYAKFRYYRTCKTCNGSRFSQLASTYKIEQLTIVDMIKMPLEGLYDCLLNIRKKNVDHETIDTPFVSSKQQEEVLTALSELTHRLNYLLKIGVGYLTLDRESTTLSGGELQRIHMARCLGNHFSDTLFCLDEPTSGLHAQDTHKLMTLLKGMVQQGNTVVIVEHDVDVIAQADHCVVLGPGAGHQGGDIVASGTEYKIKGEDRLALPIENKSFVKKTFEICLQVKNAKTHNLKGIDVTFPLACLIGVCGVSGSGKTSLIQHTLYPLLKKKLNPEALSLIKVSGKALFSARALRQLSDVHFVDQSPLSRSSRSNIATYLGVFQDIRQIFVKQELAKKYQFKPGDFSFNVPGGRCETCKGLGTIVEDLSFLGEVNIVCPTCEGKRFKEEILAVRFRGLSLLDVLSLTVTRAREVFFQFKKIVQVFDRVIEVGLGYITLGQHLSSFSGGEAQRLKLLSLTTSIVKDKPSLLIFDEPTTGLANADVAQLLRHFRVLIASGHSVLVVEHHLGLLSACDWLIEIGPKAAAHGGELLYQGPVDGLRFVKESSTRPFLFRSNDKSL